MHFESKPPNLMTFKFSSYTAYAYKKVSQFANCSIYIYIYKSHIKAKCMYDINTFHYLYAVDHVKFFCIYI